MSFQVIRHEHHNIFVVNRQTYETYRFTINDDGALTEQGGSLSDLGEARRAAVAFLAQSRKEKSLRSRELTSGGSDSGQE
jgi:hypothetical protein